MSLHQVGKHINGILAPNAPGHMDGEAFPGVLIDDHHQLDRATIDSAVKDKVPTPDVIRMLGATPIATVLTFSKASSFSLFLGHFQRFPVSGLRPASA